MNNLIRFNPPGSINRFDPLTDFERMFDRLAWPSLRPAWRDPEIAEPQIRMDIAEAGNEYIVKAEIPGVKKDDIHVSVDGNMVSISAEVKHEMDAGEGSTLLRSERCYGKTMRSFRLGQDVIEDKAEAKYADGVLELKLPKKNGAPHKEIAIS
jgi:HSP20 family protein